MAWMTNLFYSEPGFAERPLSNITLPGTHDTGCYVDHLISNYLSKTQTQDVAGQLAGGIRYFDIRPYMTAANEFWTYHGPIYVGGQLDGAHGILSQVNQFMQQLARGDRELVILNISHFYNFNNAMHQSLIQQIQNIVGDNLVPYTQAETNLFNADYRSLLERNGETRSRVAIIYDGALDTGLEAYVSNNALPRGFFKLSPKYNMGGGATNQIWLFDQFANKAYMDDGNLYTGMVTDQMNKLANRQNYVFSSQGWANAAGNWTPDGLGVAGTANTMHLLSWTLTPQIRFANPIPIAQQEVNPRLLPQFTGNNWRGGNPYDPTLDPKINIIYSDDYGSETYAGVSPIRAGLAMPVAISDYLNRFVDDQGDINWAGWGGF